MKIFDIFKSTEDNNKNNEDIIENVVEDSLPEVEPEEEEKISYYDEFGKEHIVEKKKWVEKKLNPDIRKNWDNVEALYPIVLDAF